MEYTLSQAIHLAFDYLDKNYKTKWSTTAATREKLIEAFSQTDLSPAKYLGYKTNDGIRHAMQRAILEPKCEKPKGQEYRDWLLSLLGLFLCNCCKQLCLLPDKVKSENQCKKCDTQESKSKQSSKRELLYRYLSDKVCVDCGVSDPVILEFDHLDPATKVNNISNMMSCSWSVILTEINKCDIVCANCHRRRTAKNYNWYSFLK